MTIENCEARGKGGRRSKHFEKKGNDTAVRKNNFSNHVGGGGGVGLTPYFRLIKAGTRKKGLLVQAFAPNKLSLRILSGVESTEGYGAQRNFLLPNRKISPVDSKRPHRLRLNTHITSLAGCLDQKKGVMVLTSVLWGKMMEGPVHGNWRGRGGGGGGGRECVPRSHRDVVAKRKNRGVLSPRQKLKLLRGNQR